MEKSTASVAQNRATPRAALAALGVHLVALDFFAPVRSLVQVAQKTVEYSPTDKLYDCFVGILAGAQAVCDINRVLRADPALQAAFGRSGCAEQSTLQDTLDAASSLSVAQMEAAFTEIVRRHSRVTRHDFAAGYLLLDADVTGAPCGPKAACATKGYFAGKKNRQGRQIGRVLASDSNEIVADRLFEGTVQLTTALQPLMAAAQATLALTPEQRARTIVRVDSGGGSIDQVNALLEEGYVVLCKDYSSTRAAKLAQSVTRWYDDPKEVGRQVGWVTVAPTEYVQPVRRMAVRYRKPNGQWGLEVLICTVPMEEVYRRVGATPGGADAAAWELRAILYLYDGRGGACETSFQEDQYGLGTKQRNKRRFSGQEMLIQLAALAHNVLVWAKGWLMPAAPRLDKYGIVRLVRDVLGMMGRVRTDAQGRVCRIVLNEADRLAHHLLPAWRELLTPLGVRVVLGRT
jgi:hypothetical protein